MTAEADNVVEGMFGASGMEQLAARTEKGKWIDCWQNVELLLTHLPEWRGVLAFDAFAQVPMKLKPTPWGGPPGEWSPDDELRLGQWLLQQRQLTIKALATLNTGMLACAKRAAFHPVVDWLKKTEWDGKRRLEFWLSDCLGATPTPYTALVGKFFIMNMVRRVTDPGCIMRYVPILEGAQNKGKSTALRILGGEWYSDAHLDLTSKDAFELIQGVWLQEIAEMGAFNKSEANRVKHFVSTVEDSWVPKYIRGRIRVKRQVAFAGTTNERQYLKDWTGNTRFLPVRCLEEGEINLDALAERREQLFAEALALLKRGERAYATPEQESLLFAPEQDERQIEHPWRQPVLEYLEEPRPDGKAMKVTTHELLTKALRVDVGKLTLNMQQDVGRVMDALGWVRKRTGTGARGYFYERPQAVDAAQQTVAEAQRNDEDLPI